MPMKNNTSRVTLTALFAVIIAFCAWISVPTPLTVPVTLQIFGVALCGFLLGPKMGLGCTAVYISMGALGLPVFSFFQGGLGVLTSANGGFVFGFLILSLCCGLNTLCKPKFILPLIGVLLCHAVGLLQFCLVSGSGFWGAFLTVALPFLIKDIFLVWLAGSVSKRIRLEDFL